MKLTLDLLPLQVKKIDETGIPHEVKENIKNIIKDEYKWISDGSLKKVTNYSEKSQFMPTLFDETAVKSLQVSGCGCKSQCDCKGNCDCRSECMCRAECVNLCGSKTDWA